VALNLRSPGLAEDEPAAASEARGFRVFPGVITAADVAAIKGRLAYIAAHATFFEECGVCFTPAATGGTGAPDPLERFQQIGNVPFLDTECRAHLLTHRGFARVAMAMLGPDFNVINAGFFLKPAGHGAEVPWHQDTATWGVPAGAWTAADAPQIFDYWLALDRADPDNGCLELLPGSHQRGLFPHVDLGGLLPEANPAAFGFDPAQRVVVTAEPGDLVVYHPDLFHRSCPNRSARARLAAAGTLIAPRDIPRIRALLPQLDTLERCPVYRAGRPVPPARTLPKRATPWGLLRRRVARRLRSRLLRAVRASRG
jgi:ectoine hydroxylase-related dioxygenase (phytanoyl-CoA dioxygenase family)